LAAIRSSASRSRRVARIPTGGGRGLDACLSPSIRSLLIDAFIIRTVLVPAVMHLLGRSNWWLPSWLDARLPHVSVEGPDDPGGPPLAEPVVA
jgi:hypothetical protein